ncbi:MAG TPA: cupin domain-containing protein, partial [Polyangiaceae bacterium]|nr:cupin domain-containing protein [Polyangiaceae bacterium]
MQILVERNPSDSRLQALQVTSWPQWTKEPSTFPWTYEEQEICYFLEGQVVVTPQGGTPVTM